MKTIVCKICCKNCNVYTGQSGRHSETWIKKHMQSIVINNNWLKYLLISRPPCETTSEFTGTSGGTKSLKKPFYLLL